MGFTILSVNIWSQAVNYLGKEGFMSFKVTSGSDEKIELTIIFSCRFENFSVYR